MINQQTFQEPKKLIYKLYGKDVSEIEPIGKGEWSTGYFFRVNDQNKVLRISTTDEDFRKDEFVAEIAEPKLPVPKLEKIGKIGEKFYAISNRIDGQYLDKQAAGDLDNLLSDLTKKLILIAKTDISMTSGWGSWTNNGKGSTKSWQEYLLRVNSDKTNSRIPGWEKNLNRSRFGTKEFDFYYRELEKNLDFLPDKRYLIHGDLLHYNVLVKENHVSAVLDWGCSMFGDFLYDVAWFGFWKHWFPEMKKIDFIGYFLKHMQHAGLDTRHSTERINAYHLHMALDNIAYSSFKENWEMVGQVLKKLDTLKL